MMPNHVSTHAEVIATWHSLHIHPNKNHYVIHLLIAVVNFHKFIQFSHTYHFYVHALSIAAVLTAFRFAFLASQHPASTKCHKGLARLRRQMRATNWLRSTCSCNVMNNTCHQHMQNVMSLVQLAWQHRVQPIMH